MLIRFGPLSDAAMVGVRPPSTSETNTRLDSQTQTQTSILYETMPSKDDPAEQTNVASA